MPDSYAGPYNVAIERLADARLRRPQAARFCSCRILGYAGGDRDTEDEDMDDLFEIMQTTRSMRRLKPDPVPDELIRKILEAGACAANGGNTQRWRFLVIKDPQDQAGGAGLVQEGVRRGGRPALRHQRAAARRQRRSATSASIRRWNI